MDATTTNYVHSHHLVSHIRKPKRCQRHEKQRDIKRGIGVGAGGMKGKCGYELKPVEEAMDEDCGCDARQPGDVLIARL